MSTNDALIIRNATIDDAPAIGCMVDEFRSYLQALGDVFSVGGAPSSVLPAGLDRNRIELAALPAFVQTGDRVESARAEVELRGVPVIVYGERLRAWNDGGDKPRPVRVFGAELRIGGRVLPAAFSGELSFYAGVAKIRSSSPRFDSTRGYAGLLYRP